MCTVTYLPTAKGYILTSSRDEHYTRDKALQPAIYFTHNGNNLLYPKDTTANGTWIAAKQNGDAIVLLNGAFENHSPKAYYAKSRGLILLDIFNSRNPIKEFSEIDLTQIQAFTLVIVHNNFLYEARWDGENKHLTQLSNKENHIWSSATLYSKSVQQQREKWFASWLQQQHTNQQKDVLQFHLHAGDLNAENNIKMNRDNKMFTVSITSIQSTNNEASMLYYDVIDDKKTITNFTCEAVLI